MKENDVLLSGEGNRDYMYMSSADSTRAFLSPHETDTESATYTYEPLEELENGLERKLGITLSWENIAAQLPGVAAGKGGCLPCRKGEEVPPKPILKGVSGVVKPGSLQVIMGASGSGKTTLMNCLLKRNVGGLTVSGVVRVNGQPVGENINNISGYVQQDDIFFGSMTVNEHLWFNARLKMEQTASAEDRESRIQVLLAELGLKKCENTFIGIPGMLKGLSGGEKKRLAFATELLADPPMLFCDEPTSGLDAYMAQSVTEALIELAGKGKTILCTIHQPSSDVFAKFDQLLLMAEGRVAYMGPTNQLSNFFNGFGLECPECYNPADFYIQSLAIVPGLEEKSRQNVKTICDRYSQSIHCERIQQMVEANRDPHDLDQPLLQMDKLREKECCKVSWGIQLQMLLWRGFIEAKRNKRVLQGRLIQMIAASILTGSIFWQTEYNQAGVSNISSAFFVVMIQVSLSTAFTIATSFTKEYASFIREVKDRVYEPTAYYLGKIIVDVPLFLVSGTLFAIITFYMIGLSEESIVRYCATLALLSSVGVAYGHMVSAITNNVLIALSVLPLILGLSFLLTGFFIAAGTINVIFIPLQALSFYRYAFEILLVNQWIGVDSIECEYTDVANDNVNNWNISSTSSVNSTSSSSSSNWCLPDGPAVITSNNYEPSVGRMDELLFVLLGFFLAAELIGFISLTYKAKKAR